MAPIAYPFRVVPDIWEPPDIQDDDTSLWMARWDTAAELPLPITFERTTMSVKDMTAEGLADLASTTGIGPTKEMHAVAYSSFAGLQDDTGVKCEEMTVQGRKEATHFVTASDIETMAKRCLDAHLAGELETCESADLVITIDYGRSNTLVFKQTIDTDFYAPTQFDDVHTRALRRMAHMEIEPEVVEVVRDATPAVPVQAFDDATEVSGDIFARPMSEVGFVGTIEVRDDQPDQPALTSAALCVDVSPTAKYTALSRMLLEMGERGGATLILGDSPGTLGQAQVAEGIVVYGVDPKNSSTRVPGIHGRADYTTVEGEAALRGNRVVVLDRRDNEWRIPDGISRFVIDTARDDETAASSTARNLELGWRLKRERPTATVVVQARSPPLHAGDYGVMALPGHSNQGCEAYLVLLSGDQRSPGARTWDTYCWATVRIGIGDGEAAPPDHHDEFFFRLAPRHARDADVVRAFFQPWTDSSLGGHDAYRGRGSLGTWYHFIVSRAFLEARATDRRGVPAAVLSAANPVELCAILENASHDKGDEGISAVFNVDYAEGLTGVAPGLFNRHPSLRDIVRGRYEGLTRMTVFDEAVTPEEVAEVFRRPASGVLLRGLSAMRALDKDWGGPKITRYKRVLPYEYMAVLASKPLYHAVYMYLFACMHGLGKPMHAWEMQYMLWTLTMHGTAVERYRYIAHRLRSAVQPIATGRRAPALGPGRDTFLATFERNMRVLGVAEAYATIDPHYEAARQRIFARTRDPALRPDQDRQGYSAEDTVMSDAPMPPPPLPKHRRGTTGKNGSGMSAAAVASWRMVNKK